jgi:hypothetical protein
MKINKKNINKKRERFKELRKELEGNQLRGIKELIPKERINKICREAKYEYRRRQLTPMATLLHMLGAALSREQSFQSSWQNSGQTSGSDILCKARQRLPEAVWDGVDRWIMTQIDNEFGKESTWRGHRIIGIDGTCVSMSDEKELADEFGRTESKHGQSRFPIARVVFAVTLKTQITLSHQIGRYKTSEQELLRRMIKEMLEGDLIICDRHYAGANLYVEYKNCGLEFITPSHQMLNINKLKRIKEHAPGDLVVEIPITPKHRRENTNLPENIVVRLIEVKAKVRGKKVNFWLVSSLIDSAKYSADEIRGLYRRRWRVETLIEEIKIWLGSDVLRSKTAPGIRKEIYARIVAGNLIHWLILKAAKKYKKDPTRISTVTATRLINCYSWRMHDAEESKINMLYEELLGKIASAIIPYRPNRNEPRMKRRDQKHYSILHTTRAQWRQEHGIGA